MKTERKKEKKEINDCSRPIEEMSSTKPCYHLDKPISLGYGFGYLLGKPKEYIYSVLLLCAESRCVKPYTDTR